MSNEDEPRVFPGKRFLAGLAFAVYLAILGTLSLPYVTVCCETSPILSSPVRTRSETLSGWELVQSKVPTVFEPSVSGASGSRLADLELERRQVAAIARSASTVARWQFAVVLLTGFLALLVALFPDALALAWMLFWGGAGVALGFVALLTAGFDLFGPPLQHHYGYWIAAGFSLLALCADYRLLQQGVRAQTGHPAFGTAWLLLGIPLFFIAVIAGGAA